MAANDEGRTPPRKGLYSKIRTWMPFSLPGRSARSDPIQAFTPVVVDEASEHQTPQASSGPRAGSRWRSPSRRSAQPQGASSSKGSSGSPPWRLWSRAGSQPAGSRPIVARAGSRSGALSPRQVSGMSAAERLAARSGALSPRQVSGMSAAGASPFHGHGPARTPIYASRSLFAPQAASPQLRQRSSPGARWRALTSPPRTIDQLLDEVSLQMRSEEATAQHTTEQFKKAQSDRTEKRGKVHQVPARKVQSDMACSGGVVSPATKASIPNCNAEEEEEEMATER